MTLRVDNYKVTITLEAKGEGSHDAMVAASTKTTVTGVAVKSKGRKEEREFSTSIGELDGL